MKDSLLDVFGYPELPAKTFSVTIRKSLLSDALAWLVEGGYAFTVAPADPERPTTRLLFEDEAQAEATAARWA